ATDPDRSLTVTLSAYGGPLSDISVFPDSLSPATFASSPGNPALGTFTWNTVCLDIRSQPYEVVFKAQNNYQAPLAPLTDLNPWLIDVI
ncbi:hypothetical protein ACI4A4_28025, partial [Klebsiella pneumoniae]|uniref:hypothetical protein n=1 Tax=Klebsiella pneumoniae TaxID=573 RepID=UPI003852E87D